MSKAYRRLQSWTRRLARVLNFEKNEDSGYVNYPIHHTAVIMHHHPTNVTRMISIFEAFIDRATAYSNQGSQ